MYVIIPKARNWMIASFYINKIIQTILNFYLCGTQSRKGYWIQTYVKHEPPWQALTKFASQKHFFELGLMILLKMWEKCLPHIVKWSWLPCGLKVVFHVKYIGLDLATLLTHINNVIHLLDEQVVLDHLNLCS
jgi:hypothetical protein